MPELVDAIDALLAAKGRDAWGEIFDREGLIWGPVLTLEEVAEDPQAEAIDMFPAIEHAERGSTAASAPPCAFAVPTCGRAVRRRRWGSTPAPCSKRPASAPKRSRG
jgi:crotonobetainyl-CoA:carnitine CoA-transferase CaiB-like acyl-CoA transferase